LKALTTKINKRNFGLDLFRAIAVLAVVFGHGCEFINVGIKTWFPVDGVDMFFVLSGFLIGTILLRTKVNNRKELFTQTATFYKRRWFRTLPNYFLFLAINIILVKTGVYDGILNINTLAYFAFLQNFTLPLDLFFWESWSLAVEEWFYLLFPILIFLSFLLIKKNKTYKSHYLIISLVLLIIPFILRVIYFNPNYIENDVDLFIRKIVVFRIDTIAYGLIGAYINKYYNILFKKYSILFLIVGIIGIIGIRFFVFEPSSFFRQTISFSLQSMFILFWIPAFYRLESVPIALKRPVSFISLISYSLYLVHLPILYIISKHNVLSNNHTLEFIVYLLVSVIISYFIYKFWEKPFTNLRNKQIKLLGLKF